MRGDIIPGCVARASEVPTVAHELRAVGPELPTVGPEPMQPMLSTVGLMLSNAVYCRANAV